MESYEGRRYPGIIVSFGYTSSLLIHPLSHGQLPLENRCHGTRGGTVHSDELLNPPLLMTHVAPGVLGVLRGSKEGRRGTEG